MKTGRSSSRPRISSGSSSATTSSPWSSSGRAGCARSRSATIPQLELIQKRGYAHEQAYIARLRAEGREVLEIATGDLKTPDQLRAAEAETLAAMRAGADIIFQATFFDGRWRGHADFLVRRDDRPSDLGSWSYDVADTKLARRVKAAAILQMCVYADLLERLQGVPPETVSVVTGDGVAHPHRLEDYAAYYRAAKSRFEERLAAEAEARRCGATRGRCGWSHAARADVSRARRSLPGLPVVVGLRGSPAGRRSPVDRGRRHEDHAPETRRGRRRDAHDTRPPARGPAHPEDDAAGPDPRPPPGRPPIGVPADARAHATSSFRPIRTSPGGASRPSPSPPRSTCSGTSNRTHGHSRTASNTSSAMR